MVGSPTNRYVCVLFWFGFLLAFFLKKASSVTIKALQTLTSETCDISVNQNLAHIH